MIALKRPINIDEQIVQMKKHGMIIANEKSVRDFLANVSYYRFMGYLLQFRKCQGHGELQSNVTFEQCRKIYEFDCELRNLLRRYIEIIEVFYRNRIAYCFALKKCVKSPFMQHYDENNFYNKLGYHEVMQTFDKQEGYYKDSLIVKHHKSKYDGKYPLWVMTELMSLSNLSKLYCAMYLSDKQEIANVIRGKSVITLENRLHCVSVMRNKCAHAARLYNTRFYPPVHFGKKFLRKYPEIKNDSLFAYLLCVLKCLNNEKDKDVMISEIVKLLSEYKDCISLDLLGIPNDYEKLLLGNKF